MSKLNNIPKHWQVKKLGEVCQTTSGGTPSRGNKNYYEGTIPWVKSGELDRGLILDTEEKISEEAVKYSSAKVFPKGTLLIALYGATIGKLAFLGVDAATNQAVCGIYKNENIDSNYLYHFLFSKKPSLVKQGIGGAQPNISQGILKNLDIPIPPLSEQLAIVSKIEELLSDLENGKQQLLTAQQQLKVYRQSLLKTAFEGKLTSTSLSEQGSSSEAETKEGELPKEWKWVKTGEVIDIINNGYTPSKENLFDNEGEVPFLKVYNLNFDGTLNHTKNPVFIPDSIHKKDLKRSICYPGDVLINIVGPPLGKVSIVSNHFPEWNINQAIVMFRPNENILSKYISYFLQNPVTTNWLEGTSKATAGQWNVKVSTCRVIPMPFPPIKEQHQIVEILESKLTVCDKIEETISQSLLQAETLKQSILKKAFEGKLV